jgi:hypothetical protein
VKLSDRFRIEIDPEKLTDYLLSEAHPVGRFKAAFFRSLGFARDDWQALEAGILELAASHEATEGEETEFGRKYVITGMIRGPGGQTASVVTIWIVLAGKDAARFVTAFPE